MRALWFKGMTAGYWYKVVMSSGVMTLETSGGPIVYAGSGVSGIVEGFTIPIALQATDDDDMYWTAWR